MNYDKKGIAKTKRRKKRQKEYFLLHETVGIRRMSNRYFRRKGKQRLHKNTEDIVTPVGKEYKTRGWLTW